MFVNDYIMHRYNWSSERYSPIKALTIEDTEEFFKNASHRLEKTIVKCVIAGVAKSCTDVIDIVMTDAGTKQNTICR